MTNRRISSLLQLLSPKRKSVLSKTKSIVETESEENVTITLAKTVDEMLNSKTLDEILHSKIDDLKTIIKSMECFIYLTKRSKVYLSLQQGVMNKDLCWTIEEDSPKLAAKVAFDQDILLLNNMSAYDENLEGCHLPDLFDYPVHVLFVPLLTKEEQCLGVLEFQRYAEEPYSTDDIQHIVCTTSWIITSIDLTKERKYYEEELKLRNNCLDSLTNAFWDETDLDFVITKLTQVIKKRLGAERSLLYKCDINDNSIYSFEESSSIDPCADTRQMFRKPTPTVEKDGLLAVALKSKEIINIKSITDPRISYEIDKKKSGVTLRSALVLSIWSSSGKILGVFMLLNKIGSMFFTENDENILLDLSPFLIICMDYDHFQETEKSIKRDTAFFRKFAEWQLEPCEHDTYQITCFDKRVFESAKIKLNNPLWYKEIEVEYFINHMVIQMFFETAEESKVNLMKIQRMIVWIRKAYRPNPYHNFDNAVMSCHFIYYILDRNPDNFTEVEKLALLFAGLFRDVDHPGLNNNYFYMIKHNIALLYEESCLQNHQVMVALSFLNNNNIFEEMDSETYKIMIEKTKQAMLATDINNYFINLESFSEIRKNFSFHNEFHRRLLLINIMTLSKKCTFLKDFDFAKKWTNKLYKEFYYQGDLEREMGQRPVSMMNRKKRHLVPEDQLKFYQVFLIPCTLFLYSFLPNTKVFYNKALENCDRWKEILREGPKYWNIVDNYLLEEMQSENSMRFQSSFYLAF